MAPHEDYGSTNSNPIKSWFGGGNKGSNGQDHRYQSVSTGNDPPKEFASLENETARASNKSKFWTATLLIVVVVAGFLGYHYYPFHASRDKNPGGDGFSYQYITDDQYEMFQNDTAERPLKPVKKHRHERKPFSTVHPIELGVPQYERPDTSRPSVVLTGNQKQSLHFPTNAWYQNMLLVASYKETLFNAINCVNDTNTHIDTDTPLCKNVTITTAEPGKDNRAYATPFVVDAVGPVPGIRIIPNHISASTSVIQMNTNEEHGLTVGAGPLASSKHKKAKTFSNEYRVEHTTPLGLTLGWAGKSYPMHSSIVKGMPYGTMVYETTQHQTDSDETWYPTVAASTPVAKEPIVDGKYKMACKGASFPTVTTTAPDSNSSIVDEGPQYKIRVEHEVELYFGESDFTWLVFVSRPVTMQCVVNPNTRTTHLQVVDDEEDGMADGDENDDDQESVPPFVMRIALSKYCTSNKNPIYCHYEQMIPYSLGIGQGRYDDLLRNHSRLVPGPNTHFDYHVDQVEENIDIVFDWDARDMQNYNEPSAQFDEENSSSASTLESGLIAFALPHHLDLMGTRFAPGYLKYCTRTLIGPACMLAGSVWKMAENVPPISFRAPRPPAPWAIQSMAKSAKTDLKFKMPELYEKGAGDTYFSGKMLAKLGRILVISEELKEICGEPFGGGDKTFVETQYQEACRSARLPSDYDMNDAIDVLRSAVEIWLNGKGITPFVYDSAWGGVVSCGCNNPDGGDCRNTFPECPGFTDPGLNFGNAYYNDLHFHYGYHIYAAAVVSHFDPVWAKKYFERVMLLVRNIANPSDSGDYFPAFRMKDVYQGHSWASGIATAVSNGRNQESSSESLAGYEAVALYGKVMKSVFNGDEQKQEVAEEVEQAGQVLTATELRSTRRYYHVRDRANSNDALKIYPKEYTQHAIGMMWNTMAQYQTWFGGKPYLAAGIQLLPITPIAEQRDGTVWLGEMYPSYASSCGAEEDCESNGWSVLQLTSLATIGYQEDAAKGALALKPEVFDSAGGNGHSLTNTLWYIATRKYVSEPIAIGGSGSSSSNATSDTAHKEHIHEIVDCYVPDICTDYVLDTIADEYSCRQRMTDLINTKGHTQEEACFMIAQIQFPKQCGACVPNATETSKEYYRPQCPPCTVDQCKSDLNRCPRFPQTFVCTDGMNRGGCSRFPWDIRSVACDACCELTECFK